MGRVLTVNIDNSDTARDPGLCNCFVFKLRNLIVSFATNHVYNNIWRGY